MAGAARDAVIGGDPWRQDRGGVVRADPSVAPVGMGRRMIRGAPRLGRPLACPPACLARGVACGGAPCGRAPGAGVAGGPSVRPVGPWPAHRPWRRTPPPARGAPPDGGPRVPRRVRPGAFPARLTTACSGPRWRGSLGWAQFWCPAGQLTPNSWAAVTLRCHLKFKV